MIEQIDTIPSGLMMVERAEVYVDTAGTHYIVWTPSPNGMDDPKQCFASIDAVYLAPGFTPGQFATKA